MAWGGARPNSGPKRRSDRPAVNRPIAAPKVIAARPDVQERRRQAIEERTIREAIAASYASAEKKRERPPELNPFKMPEFPPAAIPKKESGLRMATDESLTWAGAQTAGAWMGGLANEGLLFLGYPYLAELAQRPEYRVMSETIATEMTRKWIKFQATSDEKDKTDRIKELQDFGEHLKLRDSYADLALQDGLFGRSHLFHDFGDDQDQELKTPIGNGRDAATKAKVSKEKPLRRLQVVEPVWTYPTTYNAVNPLAPDWYNPQVWYVMGKEIHCSRILKFIGRPVPDLLKPAYSFGGLSLTQMAKPYVDNWLTTRTSVGQLIHSFSVMVLMTDLQTILQPGNATNLMARVELFNALRDNQGAFVLNKATEDFKNVSASLSGLSELQSQAQEHMMSVCRIPAVKFTGMQPHGLNASSEGEIRAFYDTIAAYQNRFFRPNLTTTIDLMMISLWGERDPDITFDFEPLWELSEKEKSEKRKADAETGQILIDSGAISPAEERARVVGDPESLYQGLDPDEMPEPPTDELTDGEPGAAPPPGGGEEEDDAQAEASAEERGAEDATLLPFVAFGEDPTFAGDSWNESDHPRAPDGKFGSGGGSSALKPDALTKVGGQKGSNPGGVYKDSSGTSFYIKKGQSKAHVQNELLAANLYQLAGAPTLKYRPVEGGGYIATEMTKLEKSNAGEFTAAEKKKAAEDFAVHAWLANWDALGIVGGGDNQGIVNGVPTSLDLGGALAYRAQGAPKGHKFGTSVGEFTTLRDPKMNPNAAAIFGKMKPEELKKSVAKVAKIPDADIRAAVEAAGLGSDMADKLIARKRDLAQKVGMQAHDAGWEESKHKRDSDGKFSSTGGGGSGGAEKETGGGEESGSEKKMDYGGLWTFNDDPQQEFVINTKKVLQAPAKTGNFWRNMVRRLIKDSSTFGEAHTDVLKLKLGESWAMTANKLEAAASAEKDNAKSAELWKLHEAAKVKAEKLGVTGLAEKPGNKENSELAQKLIKEAKATEKAPAASKEVEAKAKSMTEAEIKKASKGTPMPLPSPDPGVVKLTQAFNDKYQGKTLTDKKEIAQKILDYQDIMNLNQKVQVEAQAKAQAEAQAKAAKQKAAEAAAAQAQAEENAKAMKELGISEKEAAAFNALGKMLGMGQGDLIAKFKEYEHTAKKHGYPITGFQAALIANYSNGGYGAINNALRSGAWTPAQHLYVKQVNDALKKMPPYAGTVTRNTSLSKEQIAQYKAGHVIQEHALMSTSTKSVFSGNVQFKIKSIGKRSAHIKKLSNHPGEEEVLFAAKTFFHVSKVDTSKTGQTTIHMEELDDDI